MQASRSGVVEFGGLFQHFCSSAGDVEFCSVLDQSLRNHKSNARPASCYDCGDVADVEEAVASEVRV